MKNNKIPILSLISSKLNIKTDEDGDDSNNVAVSNTSDNKKSVKFADGICPGEGTSPSAGEELSSPPPPSSKKKLAKEKRYKKMRMSKKSKKKKVKVSAKFWWCIKKIGPSSRIFNLIFCLCDALMKNTQMQKSLNATNKNFWSSEPDFYFKK